MDHAAKEKARLDELKARLSSAVVGSRLTAVEHSEFNWSFAFGDSWTVTTPSYWRLLAAGQINVSADDDGQWFGLSEPVDAAERVRRALTGVVSAIEITVTTSDLRVHFGDHVLELLNTSCGYEGWNINVHLPPLRGFLVALGGGGVAGSL